MSLGTLTIDIAANVARLTEDLGKANRISEKFAHDQELLYGKIGKYIRGAFEVVGGLETLKWIKDWIGESIKAGDEALKASKSIGISVEAYQSMSYAAKVAGVNQEGFTLAMGKFDQAISLAGAGSKKQVAAFHDIGVSVKDSNGHLKTADALLLQVAGKFSGYADGANKTALAMALFGKAGAAMVPLLDKGSAGIKELMTQAERLGLVMSKETLEASEKFNENLEVLKSVSRGAANQLAAGLLPALNDITGLLIDLADNSTTAGAKTEALGTILKVITSLAISLSLALQEEGMSIGALAAATVQAVHGDFAIAAQTMKDAKKDIDEAADKSAERIDKLWNGDFGKAGEAAGKAVGEVNKALERSSVAHDKAADAAKRHAEALKKQIEALQLQAKVVGMSADETTLFKLAQDGASESQLAAAKAALDTVSAYNDAQQAIKEHEQRLKELASVEETTWTDSQKALEEYQKKVETLRDALNNGEIQQPRYDKIMVGLDKNLDDALNKTKDNTDMMSAFADQAARNMQSSFADFLFDPFKSGVGGMLKSFGSTIQKMVAEAAAAQLMDSLFGKAGAGGNGSSRTGGLLSAGMSAIGSYFGFGGGKAVGGPVEAGKMYEVGENNAPEMFLSNGRQYMIPGNSGSVVPMGKTANGGTQIFNINTPDADSFRASQRQIAHRARQQMSVA